MWDHYHCEIRARCLVYSYRDLGLSERLRAHALPHRRLCMFRDFVGRAGPERGIGDCDNAVAHYSASSKQVPSHPRRTSQSSRLTRIRKKVSKAQDGTLPCSTVSNLIHNGPNCAMKRTLSAFSFRKLSGSSDKIVVVAVEDLRLRCLCEIQVVQ